MSLSSTATELHGQLSERLRRLSAIEAQLERGVERAERLLGLIEEDQIAERASLSTLTARLGELQRSVEVLSAPITGVEALRARYAAGEARLDEEAAGIRAQEEQLRERWGALRQEVEGSGEALITALSTQRAELQRIARALEQSVSTLAEGPAAQRDTLLEEGAATLQREQAALVELCEREARAALNTIQSLLQRALQQLLGERERAQTEALQQIASDAARSLEHGERALTGGLEGFTGEVAGVTASFTRLSALVRQSEEQIGALLDATSLASRGALAGLEGVVEILESVDRILSRLR